jgi:hypothetical protein
MRQKVREGTRTIRRLWREMARRTLVYPTFMESSTSSV